MTQSPNQRLDRIEDEFETVKQLLASAARYAESANEKIDQLSSKVDDLTTSQAQTQTQLNQLTNKVDEFVFQAQRLFTQTGERLIRVEGQADRLEALLLRLDRNYEAQQTQLQAQAAQFYEFQRTTNAALERIDRVLDYLLRQHGSGKGGEG